MPCGAILMFSVCENVKKYETWVQPMMAFISMFEMNSVQQMEICVHVCSVWHKKVWMCYLNWDFYKGGGGVGLGEKHI